MYRYIGFPHQFWCGSKRAFLEFERMFKNKVPFFVSTYRYKNPSTPIIDNLFFDVDSYFSIRFPYRNAKELINFFRDKNIPTIQTYSGGKGFHIFPIFKSQTIITPQAYDKMKDLMYSVQKHVAEEVGLESYDDPTFGRIRFLVRYPTSRYIRANEEGKLEWNGNYCRNLSYSDFMKGIKHISKIVKEPGIIPQKPISKTTLKQFSRKLSNFKLEERTRNNQDTLYNILEQRDGNVIPDIDALGLPCIKKIAEQKHPSHYERIELVAWMKQLGYTDIAINAFIKQLNWTDYNYRTTSYQVTKVKPRYPACKSLRRNYKSSCKECTLFGGRRK
jgi:hypothetical protein